MIARRRKNRGSLMLGMAALIAITTAACAVVLARSLDVYRVSAETELRLAGRAAAEGAAVLLRANPQNAPDETRIGDALVRFAKSTIPAKGEAAVPITVDILASDGTVLRAFNYLVVFSRSEAGAWRFLRLEAP